jgi:hypothetical protein
MASCGTLQGPEGLLNGRVLWAINLRASTAATYFLDLVEDVTVPAVSRKITRRACSLPGPRLNMQVKATIVATQAVEKHRSIGKGCFV